MSARAASNGPGSSSAFSKHPGRVVAVVVDASALLAVLLAEPEAGSVAERVSGHALLSTSLLPYEVANAAWQKTRRKLMTGADARRVVADLGALGVHLEPADPAGVLALALETGLTAYDAGYLWLARETGAELVTLDAQLEKAWRKL